MDHRTAFALVSEICPKSAGLLWNTTDHSGCDTANAVADQYSPDEIEEAKIALEMLAVGITPAGWESA